MDAALSRAAGFAAMADARESARDTVCAMAGAEHATALAIARAAARMARPTWSNLARHGQT